MRLSKEVFPDGERLSGREPSICHIVHLRRLLPRILLYTPLVDLLEGIG
jgi:hypothetical protein